MNKIYYYPDNLRAQAKLWFWNLRDVAVIAIAFLISFFALIQIRFALPMILTVIYGVLTIRMDDSSIMDFLRQALQFYLLTQQYFEYRESEANEAG